MFREDGLVDSTELHHEGRLAKHFDEGSVGELHAVAHGFAGRVTHRLGVALVVDRTIERILVADGFHSEGFNTELGTLGCCVGLDFDDHLGHMLPAGSERKIFPTGERCQLDGVVLHESTGVELLGCGPSSSCLALCLASCFVFFGTGVPDSLQWYSVHQGLCTVETFPFTNAGDQEFFDGVAEDVPKSTDQRFGLRADRDQVIPLSPKGTSPADGSTGFACQVAVDELHEFCELFGILWGQDHVVMRRCRHDRVDLDRVLFLSSAQNTDENASELAGNGQHVEAASC